MRMSRHLAGGRNGSNRSGFTLIELLTVIAIIGMLAAIGVGLSGVASKKGRVAAIKAQMQGVMAAIESYESDFGQYPPDNIQMGEVNPAVNPLLYELVGCFTQKQGGQRLYRVTDSEQTLSSQELGKIYHRAGILNAKESPEQPKPYLSNLSSKQRRTVTLTSGKYLEVLAVPVTWPLRPPLSDFAPFKGYSTQASSLEVNPWRYNSSDPIHNPGRYDLWAEAFIGGEKTFEERTIIGNWNTEK